jgi:hypothetical protein
MHVRLVVFPSDDGLNVVIWGKWAQGSMRVRHFDTRASTITTLQDLGLITPENALTLECFTFEDSCPLFSAEVDDRLLTEHGFGAPKV